MTLLAPYESFISTSPDETKVLAKKFGAKLPFGSIVLLDGDLGAGKTTFIKGLISFLSGIDEDSIQSPTFNYVNTYQTTSGHIHHFDLYRIETDEEFEVLGFLDYFDSNSISLIEWPSKIKKLLPKSSLKISIIYLDDLRRNISIETNEHLV